MPKPTAFFEGEISVFLTPFKTFFEQRAGAMDFRNERFDDATKTQTTLVPKGCYAVGVSLSQGDILGLSFNKSFQLFFPEYDAAFNNLQSSMQTKALKLGYFIK